MDSSSIFQKVPKPAQAIEEKQLVVRIEELRKYTHDTNLVDLILVWKGYKLASEFPIGDIYPEIKEDEWGKVMSEVESVLATMLLKFSKRDEQKSYEDMKGRVEYRKFLDYSVSRDAESLGLFDDISKLDRSKDNSNITKKDSNYGKLYGFPETAVTAFLAGEGALIKDKFQELPKGVIAEDYMAFANFELSKAHWQEELETVKKWAEEIRKTNPALYDREVSSYKEFLLKEQ